MRIINRKDFLALPEGALFSKYKPCVFDPPCIKGGSSGNDFFFTSIVDDVAANSSGDMCDVLMDAEKTGKSFELEFDSIQRDGCFDNEQLFAVWEPEDVRGLIRALYGNPSKQAMRASERAIEIIDSLECGFGGGHRYLNNVVRFLVAPEDHTDGFIYHVTIEKKVGTTHEKQVELDAMRKNMPTYYGDV